MYGYGNTAIGSSALQNPTGSENTAVGYEALALAGGQSNTAVGMQALANLVSGPANIAIGWGAGYNLTAGGYNIMIGSQGTSGDTQTIRIGTPGAETSTYIAGISGIGVSSGTTVVVNGNGQLGVESSSRRYKEDIQDMGDTSTGLLRLRPVTFHYKKPDSDGSKPLEYGLIAEEVADVYPELVVRGMNGQVESIQYQKLPAMLLNELQKQYQQIQSQSGQIEALQKLEQTNLFQREQIQKLETRLAALEAQLASSTAKVPSGKDLPSGGR
jgi:hypothetical protein